MKKRTLSTIAPITLSLATTLSAVDTTWEGVNSSESNSSADVELGSNWDTGNVPGTGDTAIFNYQGDPTLQGSISIDSTDTLFDPSGLIFRSNEDPSGFTQTSPLIIDKSLNLTNGLQIVASGSANSGSRDGDRLQIGTNSFGTTWNIDSLDINEGMSWSFFELGIGDSSPNNSTVLNITGDQTFAANTNTKNGNININGGVTTENETNTLAPQMRFTGVGATITLNNAGQRTTGVIGLGGVHLDVRSDQTWIADATSFVNMEGSVGASGFAGKYVVESIDGGRLDNLGALNIRINGNQNTSASATTAMRMHGGTYGSLWMNSSGTSGRDQRINATDDLSFAAAVVDFDGAGDPYASDYGLRLRNDAGNSDAQILDMGGFNLDVANGVHFVDEGSATDKGYIPKSLLLIVEGSTVDIGGDVLMEAPNGRGPEAPAGGSGNFANNKISLDGGATGADVTLGGSWDVRVVGSTRDNLKNSTLTMTGDSATFEIADASTVTNMSSSSWGVDTFNVGTTGDLANVSFVNNYLNDNTATGDANLDKIGEQFVANTVNIGENSTLDTAGETVRILNGLSVDATGTLDLNTGAVLGMGSIVDSFFGDGDMTALWNVFADRVLDSSNAGYQFTAVLDGGQTKWQVSAVPEPSTYALIFAGVMGAVVYFRRRK